VRLPLAEPGTASSAMRQPRSPEPAVPGYGENVRQIRGICPDSCAWPSRDRNPALLKGIRTGATGSRAPDGHVQGPRWPPTAGNYTESKLQPRCGESIQARPHRAADCAARSLPQRDGYPLRGPRARSTVTGSRRRSRGQLPSVSAGVRRGMPPRLPGTYFHDV